MHPIIYIISQIFLLINMCSHAISNNFESYKRLPNAMTRSNFRKMYLEFQENETKII